MQLRDRYIDLMQKTLTFEIWPEPGRSAAAYAYRLPTPLRWLTTGAISALNRVNLDLVTRKHYDSTAKADGRLWPGYAHTMLGTTRMTNLRRCVETVLLDGIPGDLMETGVWRGGACIFMRAILAAYEVTDRRVFVADSFQGLPEPMDDYPADANSTVHEHNPLLAVSRAEVAANFEKYGLLDEQVVFIEGYFEDTMQNAPVESLSVLRLDGDMYSSTISVLEAMYPKLSPGGFCIVDDYNLPNCRLAVEEYRAANIISEPIEQVDWTASYWRKRLS